MNLFSIALIASIGCRDKVDPDETGLEVDADADTDADTDTDSDADADTDTDTDADTDIEDVDEDGDGFTVAEGDCDDADPSVFPGAEDAWYDGIDSDCAGDDDYDQDGDGEASLDEGAGIDCDDTDPGIHSGAEEVQDAVDNDCDGMADEGFLSYGDVIVTEIMLDAVAVGDTTGEWFEVHNPGPDKINLQGFVISSDDGDSFEVKYNLPIPAGGYKVFGVEKDLNLNGGATVNYWYNRDKFKLNNSGDSFILQLDGVTIFELEVSESWGIEAGASLGLDTQFTSASYAGQSAYWCVATTAMSGGDLGTPAAANDWCSSVDHDGDGTSEDEGDCDDADASINADATEIFDGLDNNCDGSTDDVVASDAAVGILTGATYGYLGSGESFGLVDIDEDGDNELLVGGLMMPGYTSGAYYAGEVYALDAADFDTWNDPVGSVDEGRVQGDTYGYASAISQHGFADNDGDGTVDLAVAGVGYGYAYYNDAVLALYSGGSGFAGDMDNTDATLLITGVASQSYYQGVMPSTASNGDLDGDGVAEVIVGAPTGTDRGIYVFSLDGLSGELDLTDDADQTWTIAANSMGGNFVAAHDLDGDGYDDMLATAQGDNGGRGAVYIVYGGTGGAGGTLTSDYDVRIGGYNNNAQLGQAGGFVIADLDGDASDDLAVASPGRGEVYVFSDTASLASTDTSTADITLTGSNYFGSAMTAGDVDDDGSADLLVGAPGYYAPYGYYSQNVGEVFFFSGTTLSGGGSIASSSADGSIEGEQQQGLFGLTLLAADLDGSGGDEVIVGSPSYDVSVGQVWLLDLD